MTRQPTPPGRRRTRVRRGDGGHVSAFVVVLSAAFVFAVGLVADGGTALDARLRAANLAEEAARAGAQAIDLATYRSTGALRLDPARADTAARAYLTRAGWAGTAAVHSTAATITVTVTGRVPTRLLQGVGLRTVPVTGTGTATATRGLTEPGTGLPAGSP
jgi:hypothetical protein